MKKLHKIDSNGFYLEDVIIEDDKQIPHDCIDTLLPDGFFKPQYVNGSWVESLTKDNINSILGLSLVDLKQQKINELDQACKNAILANFTATLNNIDYEFAYDDRAQSRFNGVGILFLNNLIANVEWTAYQNGQRTRISLTKDDFNTLSLAALKHQNDNITKYSDLYVKVNNVTTEDELNKIQW